MTFSHDIDQNFLLHLPQQRPNPGPVFLFVVDTCMPEDELQSLKDNMVNNANIKKILKTRFKFVDYVSINDSETRFGRFGYLR